MSLSFVILLFLPFSAFCSAYSSQNNFINNMRLTLRQSRRSSCCRSSHAVSLVSARSRISGSALAESQRKAVVWLLAHSRFSAWGSLLTRFCSGLSVFSFQGSTSFAVILNDNCSGCRQGGISITRCAILGRKKLRINATEFSGSLSCIAFL